MYAGKSIAPGSASQIDVLAYRLARLIRFEGTDKARNRESLLFLRNLLSLQFRCRFLSLTCCYNAPRRCWRAGVGILPSVDWFGLYYTNVESSASVKLNELASG
jgi:hypothetical protein